MAYVCKNEFCWQNVQKSNVLAHKSSRTQQNAFLGKWKAQQFSSRENPFVNDGAELFWNTEKSLRQTTRCSEARLRSSCRCELKELNRKCSFDALQRRGSAFNGHLCDNILFKISSTKEWTNKGRNSVKYTQTYDDGKRDILERLPS